MPIGSIHRHLAPVQNDTQHQNQKQHQHQQLGVGRVSTQCAGKAAKIYSYMARGAWLVLSAAYLDQVTRCSAGCHRSGRAASTACI